MNQLSAISTQPSAQKLKARDIVPGWPRSRSTCDIFANWHSRWSGWHMTDAELTANIAYHERQQAMLDSYFEQWRTPQEKPVMRLRAFRTEC